MSTVKVHPASDSHVGCALCKRRLDPQEQTRIFTAPDGATVREQDLLAILNPNSGLDAMTRARKRLSASLGIRWQLIKR